MNMKKAFTLIELLVVIAIIAILAAILFPVFAQAKEAAKKTQTISNSKQLGVAVQVYLADFDDTMPLAMGVRPAGTWGVGVVTPAPANAVTTAPWTQAGRILMASTIWANAMYPYIKSPGLYEVSVAPKNDLAPTADTFLAGVTPYAMGEVYNGLLHQYPSTAINNQSVVPMFWIPEKQNLKGRAFSNPALNCAGSNGDQANPVGCMFNPGGLPAATELYAGYGGGVEFCDFRGTSDCGITSWIFGKKTVITRTDSSTKSVAQGIAIDPAFAAFPGLGDTQANVEVDGSPVGYWPCDAARTTDTGNDVYPCYFRPDRGD